MIRILVLGQPFWASRIAEALDAHAPDMRATFVPQGRYARLLAAPPRAERMVIIRAGYRVGATTWRGRIFDAYWAMLRRSLPAAARCHYWLGTDVMDTLEESRKGTLRRSAVESAGDDLHLADAPWLADELEGVGIQAHTAHVPQRYRAPAEVSPLPPELTVLTYLPMDRFAFYGGDAIMAAARALPDVQFDVVGRTLASPPSAPANVSWRGWVTNMAERYAAASVVVRVPRHDGFGATVIEGLLSARHVVYTHPVPFVRRVWPPTPENLYEALAGYREAHRAEGLGLNAAGRAYAIGEFDEMRLAGRLAALVRERA